jgi:hypothetical protein
MSATRNLALWIVSSPKLKLENMADRLARLIYADDGRWLIAAA